MKFTRSFVIINESSIIGHSYINRPSENLENLSSSSNTMMDYEQFKTYGLPLVYNLLFFVTFISIPWFLSTHAKKDKKQILELTSIPDNL